MKRREFLAASGLVGVAAMGGVTPSALAQGAGFGSGAARDFFELRSYQVDSAEQKAALDAFMKDAAIPAYNRLGIKPVGAFYPRKESEPQVLYVLLRHTSLADLVLATPKLLADKEFVEKGAAVLQAPGQTPPFKMAESSLLWAFTGMPTVDASIQDEGRVFQLRIYESPSVATNQKKIEMFNTAEIAVFKKVGLNPVFFGEALVGPKMPNLTYMLGFKDEAAQGDAWKKFGGDPDWQKLRAMPEYADGKILRQKGITNLNLKPAPYSQM